jgi:hypothetical protein
LRGNAAVKSRGGAPVPIALGRKHFNNLPAACDQCHQFAALGVGQGPDGRLNKFGEMRQDPRIDRIGLRQPAGGAREVADLARIDHGYRQARRGQFTGRRDFIATLASSTMRLTLSFFSCLISAAMPRGLLPTLNFHHPAAVPHRVSL